MRAFATRFGQGHSSSFPSFVSGIRLVSGAFVSGKTSFSSSSFGYNASLQLRVCGTLAKDLSERFRADFDAVAAFAPVHVMLRGPGIVAHIDEDAGTVTIVGPEDKVAEFIDLLEQGYFAALHAQEEPPRPTEAPTATAAPRVYVGFGKNFGSVIPTHSSSGSKAKFATKSAGAPASASRPIRCLISPSWAAFAAGVA